MWGQLIYCLTLNKNKTENKSNNINIPANYLLFFFNVNFEKANLVPLHSIAHRYVAGTNFSRN